MPWRLRTSLLFAMCLVLQAAGSRGATYPFAHYTEANGIPGSSVLGIAQDTTGCIWFAARGGLVRYDGMSWQTYGTESGLPMTWQSDVAVDHRGTIWSVATTTPLRVSFFDGHRWTGLPTPLDFAAGDEVGPLALGRDDNDETLIAVGIRNGALYVRSGQSWHEIDMTPAAAVVHGMIWQGSTLYIATCSGLWRLPVPITAGSRPTAVDGAPPGPVYAVVDDPNRGRVRVVGEGWLGDLLPDEVRVDERVADLWLGASPGRVAAAIDHLGGVYLGSSGRSLYYHQATGCQVLSRETGLVSNLVADILVDREGQVWLASRRGVSRLTSRQFACYDTNDDHHEDEVSSVLRRRDGSLVLGHDTGLTFLGEPPRTLGLTRAPELFRRVIDLEEDRQGQLWVAMDRSGLARVAGDRSVRWYGADDGLRGAVFAVAEDRDGTIWAGTASGVYRLVGGRFESVPLPAVGGGNRVVIRRLTFARDGALLIGTVREGAFRLQDGRCEHWVGDPDDGFNSVYAFCEQADGSWWIGTDGGVCRPVAGRLEPLLASEPSISRPVFAITRDDAGRVWLGTNDGAYLWDGSVLRHFGTEDGICGLECNRDALTIDRQGRLWIGTDRGVTVYDERFDEVLDVPLRLRIAGYEADGTPQSSAEEVHLPAGTRELIVRFQCPAFADESRLRFATRLEGFDSGWSTPNLNPLREVRYTNLPAGRYRFRVQAFDVVGRRSPVVSSDEIVVNQVLARRPWFSLLMGLLALGLAMLLLSFVQGRRYQRRLAADVADRTAALGHSEALMRAESQRFATVLASISDGVLAVADDGTVTLANPAAAELLGRPDATLSGLTLASLMPGVEERARAALAGEPEKDDAKPGETAHCVYRLERSDRGARELDCSIAAATPPAARGGMVLAFRDVTDRRRLEQERIRGQKLESLGVLAGGIAHDFNNLLMVSLGNLSLLDAESRPDQQEALADMRAAMDRAQRLTAQLLTFARGGAPQKRLTDLRALLAEVSRLALAGTSISLELDLADDLRDAEIDRGQIEQVITNILINARQASRAGGHIRLTARNLPGETAIEVCIGDDGEGIAPEILERIFEPYFTTKEKGTGLGLAICHSVVTRHGGAIAVASRVGQGTTFTVRLPASSARVLPAVEKPASQRKPGARILVLDDEPSVRDLLVRMLAKLGHDPVAVADGEAAIATYTAARDQGRPFAAAIMDLTVPGGMGGIDTLAQLRALDPDIRAIVSSGYSRDPIMAAYREHGFAAALGKPFDSRALVDVLGVVLADGVNGRWTGGTSPPRS